VCVWYTTVSAFIFYFCKIIDLVDQVDINVTKKLMFKNNVNIAVFCLCEVKTLLYVMEHYLYISLFVSQSMIHVNRKLLDDNLDIIYMYKD